MSYVYILINVAHSHFKSGNVIEEFSDFRSHFQVFLLVTTLSWQYLKFHVKQEALYSPICIPSTSVNRKNSDSGFFSTPLLLMGFCQEPWEQSCLCHKCCVTKVGSNTPDCNRNATFPSIQQRQNFRIGEKCLMGRNKSECDRSVLLTCRINKPISGRQWQIHEKQIPWLTWHFL